MVRDMLPGKRITKARQRQEESGHGSGRVPAFAVNMHGAALARLRIFRAA